MKVFVFVTICLGFSLGFTFVEKADPEAGPTKCISSQHPELDLNRGEVLNIPFQCVRISCDLDGGVRGIGCSPVYIRKGCHEVRPSAQLPYPDCCPKEVCPK